MKENTCKKKIIVMLTKLHLKINERGCKKIMVSDLVMSY